LLVQQVVPPFPIPNSAYEIIWNHLLAYRGHKVTTQKTMWAPGGAGRYIPSTYQVDMINLWNPENGATSFKEDTWRFLRWTFLSPEMSAMTSHLERTSFDLTMAPGRRWSFNLDSFRVRRAPNNSYGNFMPFTNSILTFDSQRGYEGNPDRYDWTVVSQADYYLPNNSYRLASKGLADENVLAGNHLNRTYARYELQRVWVVDAILKYKDTHPYHRRRFYVQNDTWQILATEQYSKDEMLISGQEVFPLQRFQHEICTVAGEVTYSFTSKHMVVRGPHSIESSENLDAEELDADTFHPLWLSCSVGARCGGR
jgi:Protein of unknown function (DUF1329)